MRLFNTIGGGVRALFRKKQVEGELDEELHTYLDSAVEHKMRGGMGREEAIREARIEMGSIEARKQEVRDVGWETATESLVQDVRYGVRMLLKNPAFTSVAVLALALGIGANTAMFSVIEGVLLRPLPYSDANQLMRVASTWERDGTTTPYSSSPPDFFDWRNQNRSFSSAFAYQIGNFALTGRGEAKGVRAVMATAGLFSTLQVHPVLGREFLPQENRKGAEHVVVLTYGLWQAEFGGAADAVGKTIHLDSEPYLIIGVMPPDFRFPLTGAEAYLPIGFDDKVMSQRGAHYLRVLGRLKSGVTVAQANEDLGGIMAELRRLYPDKDGKWGVRVDRWSSAMVGQIRPALLVLLGAVGLVSLIACANISSLLLARATVRYRELAMRRALGARRSRLVRQMLTEGLLLSLLAGGASLVLAHWALTFITRFGPKDIPRLATVGINGTVLGFTLAASVASAVFLVAEVALSMMLLTGAGLLLRSFVGLRALSPGFDAAGVLTLTVSVPDARYKNSLALQGYWDQALTAMRQLPEATSVALVTPLPLSGDDFSSSFHVEGKSVPEKDEPSAEVRLASSDYFRAMTIPVRQGRVFTDADRLGAPRVLLISETAARAFFPGGDAIGQKLTFGARGGYEKSEGEIVGIVGDVHHFGLEAPVAPTFYVPLAQSGADGATIVIRTKGVPGALGHAARKAIQDIDRDALVREPVLLEDLVSGSLGQRRFYMLLLSAFAGLALVLAAIGLYGVISYSVAQKTREIGIRVAMGATRKQVLSMVMGQGLRFTVIGLAIGQVLALILNRAIKGMLVGVNVTDLPTMFVTAFVLMLVAVLACYVPARRAARVDPMEALRFD